MDNKGTYCLSENKMDANTIWQWRIMHVKKYSRHPEPFHHSNKIGLDFNIASNTEKKLDLQLVTNGVILEVCDFAETVNKGKRHFITSILENNFDLGLENEQQRSDFTAQILQKVNDLIRNPPEDRHEVFPLLDISKAGSTKNSNNGQKMAYTECTTERFLVEMDDTDDNEHEDEFICSEATSKEFIKTASLSDERDIAHVVDSEHCSGVQSKKELNDVLPPSFPHCEGIGLNLDIGSKQSLDPGLFTKGIMLEVVHFTRVLTASYSRIILDMLEHNFELHLKNQQLKNRVWFNISQLLKTRKQVTAMGRKITPEFKNEPFLFQTFASQRDRRGLCTGVEQTQTLQNECDMKQQEMGTENNYTCALGKSDLDPDKGTDSRNTGNEDHLNSRESCSLSSDNQRQLGSSYMDVQVSVLTTTDVSSTLPGVNSNVNPAFASQPVKEGLCGNEQQTQIPTNALNKCDVEQEGCQKNPNLEAYSAGSSQAAIIDQKLGSSADIEHKNELNLKLWKVRANRIQQILSIPHEEDCPLYSYSRCKKLGIDFNVGSGVKQNIDPKFLTNGIMVELNTFASALLSSRKYFVTEILEHNFNLDLKNELYRSAFAHKTMENIIALRTPKKSCTGARLKLPFELPDMRSIQETTYEKTTCCPKCHQDRNRKLHQDDSGHVNPSLQTMTDTVSADVNCTAQKPARDPSSSFSSTEETIMNSNPHCKKIGLNLCVDTDQPKDKLDRHVLTRGIMMEVANFAKKICGTIHKVINDVLEHNFNIGMQSRDLNPSLLFKNVKKPNDGGLAWLDEVFVIRLHSHRPPGYVSQKKVSAFAIQRNEWRETIQKRKLALQTKGERATLPSPSQSVVKSKKNHDTKIGLDLDVTSVLEEKEQLDSELLFASQSDERGLCTGEEQTQTPRNVANECDMEQEEMKTDKYYTCPLGESDVDPEEGTDSENTVLNKCGTAQEEIGAENNMWKLRSNRVEQIVSPLNKEFCLFTWSKKLGLEFNVGFRRKQNISIDSLTNAVLFEIAKFSIAINSSQKDFIMEILEYNFDLGLQSQHQRNVFACEIMNRVRQLRCCEDAVKFSNEVFELPGPRPLINMTNQSMGSVIPEPSSVSIMEKCDVGPLSPADSHTETKEHIPHKSVDLYPFCKEIGLKLHVNNSQPKRKLEINLLTNGAMTEVANFAEKLCGTFEQICLDILRHNFDFDLVGGDSDPAKNILARIPALVEQKNLSTSCAKGRSGKKRGFANIDFKNNPNLDACSVGSSQAAIIDENVGSSTDIEHKKEINLKLWELRTKQIQQILSIPHEEHCPLYSYSRCKKLGIDFNVASGVKQNLDPKFLTNGIMAELNAFASALLTSTKHFITEILEFNFDLDLKNELYRSAFAHKILKRLKAMNCCKKGGENGWKIPFELPDMRSIQEPSFERATYCPKCYQERTHKLGQDDSDTVHVKPSLQTMTDTVSADVNYTAKKPANDPSSTFSTTEETIMNSYPHCKKIGLTLCVDKDQPTDKLDTHFLTRGIMMEMENFAKKLCGTKFKLLHDLLEHNFNISMQQIPFIDFAQMHHRVMAEEDCGLAYFDEVFVFRPPSHRPPGYVSQMRAAALSIQRSDWRETIQKRRIALQSKEERDTLPSPNKSVVKSKKNNGSKEHLYPICTEIGLDLDVKSDLEEKEKLDSKPLFVSQSDERGVCTGEKKTQTPRNIKNECDMEQEEMKTDNYYTCLLGESHVDSDEGTDSESTGNEDHLKNREICSLSSDNQRQLESSCMAVQTSILTTVDVSSTLAGVNSNVNPAFASQPVKEGLCGNEQQTQIPRNAPKKSNMEQEGCQKNPNLEAYSADSSQAAIIDQKLGSSADIEHKNELNLKLWKVRANHIQQILSIPHEEDCPLYSYSRCKKLGIDFNVGSGVKQNFDLKFLTNGIMVELITFASALLSSEKYFITEILEHNFNLDLKNELYRHAFAHKTMKNIIALRSPKKSFTGARLKLPFELPDMRSIQETTYEETMHCPKCYQDRNHKLHQDYSDTGHVNPSLQTMTDTVSADVNCTAQKPARDPSSSFSSTEETIMNSNPHCKKIGLNLCVDTDQPKDKLDMHVLTRGIILEVVKFAKKLCGTRYKVINDVLEHNFNIVLSPDLNPAQLFYNVKKPNDGGLAWFNEVFDIWTLSHRPSRYVGRKRAPTSAMQRSGLMETIQKRKIALQTKGERATLPSPNVPRECDMKQQEMRPENCYTCPLGESDLESDEGTDSENTGSDNHLKNPESCPLSSDIHKSESSCLGMHDTLLTSTDISSSLPTVNSYANSPFASQHDEQGLCGVEEQTLSPQSALSKCIMEQEEIGTESNMWKLRSNRVEQIVSPLNKEFGQFHKSEKIGLKFNVGYGSKQNISVDSLTNTVLLEIAKFAIAINSSQKDFIREILEYNFDLGLQSQHQRNVFACEIMNRVRQLRCCEDAVKFSNEVFELPGSRPSINMTNQSMGSVIPEPSSISIMEKWYVGPLSPADSHAETKEHIPHKSVDLSPFCKEIGLKLHVNNSQPNRKLEINLLTNGAMTEVANFAEKLCGTFEQICLDILRHNFDFDLVGGDSDPAKNILARIPALVEQKNLSTSCAKGRNRNRKGTTNIDFKNNSNLDACSAGSSQALLIDQNVSSSTGIEHKKEINLKLWKLRTKQIQQILSIPHEEHCPLYSYSRCKKLGIDFDVASGVKQNLDPKFLTNGIMAELNAFVSALLSSAKHFITEILEFNFDLDLKNELYHSAFAQQIMIRLSVMHAHKKGSETRRKIPFELPDMRSIQEPSFERATYCPKCYQERTHKLGQDDSDTVHVKPSLQTMTDTVSADVNYTAKKPANDPSSTFSTTEETIMNSYPCCKKIGLTLCVDKDQPTDKLDTHFMTRGIMMEVENFAKKLCGTKFKLLHDLLEHNFNISMQQIPFIDFSQMHRRVMAEEDCGLAYFDEVFVFRPPSQRQPGFVSKIQEAALSIQRSDWRETIQKRRIALQTKEERDTLPNPNGALKSKKNQWSKERLYPICTEIGLDLDVTSKPEKQEKLDLNLLTTAVVYEIHKFLTKKSGHYFPGTLFDILDYNFDLSSQHYRRWEFAIATASKVQNTVKRYRQNQEQAGKVFKLPFMFAPKKHKRYSREEPGKYICPQREPHLNSSEVTDSRNAGSQNHLQNPTSSDIPRESKSSCQVMCSPLATTACVFPTLPTVNSNMNPLFAIQSDERGLCGGEEQTQTPRHVPNEWNMEQEEMRPEINYTCPLGESDLESDEGTDSENTGSDDHLKNPESCPLSSDIHKSESSCLGMHDTLLTSTDISSSLPTINSYANSPFASQHDEQGLCGVEEQTPSPQSVLNKFIMEQEEMGTESNMWKLRSNRVEQIVSPLNKEFGQFHKSKRIGLKFNVGYGSKQNISVDSLTNAILFEIAKFAIAINSSQKDFIMEILEYNFDLGLQSQHQRKIFACEIMNRVRQLRCCEDAVKFSNEVFELPGSRPSINMTNQSVGNAIPEPGSISRMEKCDVTPVSPVDSHAETKEHIPHKSVDLYPFCKEIGLKLHVNNSWSNRKLEINLLTNGAMTEVANFAEKLCGTFEQICLDILRHNFDLDLQGGDSDPAKNILAQIPALMEQSNLSTYVRAFKKQKWRRQVSTVKKLDYQYNPNLNVCSAGSSQAEMKELYTGTSPDIEHKNDTGCVSKLKRESAMHPSKWRETIKKRKLALQTKEERATLPSQNIRIIKPTANHQSGEDCYPICMEIGLDLDVTSESEEKEKQDLKPLFASQSDERELCTGEKQTQNPRNIKSECDMEQEKMKTDNYYTCPIGESDVESDEGADSGTTGNEDPLENPESCSLSSGIPKLSKPSCLGICTPFSTSTEVSVSLPTINSTINPPFANQLDKKGLCGSGEQTHIPRNALNNCDVEQEGCQKNPNLEACSAGSSQAPIIDQNVGSSADTEHKNELSLKLWKVRASHIQQILSIPHEEDCPLYSYSRCKKLGIDFNVGSGVKQNIDLKFLTNGIMVELNTFASALLSSEKYFITEILEHNFNLDLKNELYRSAFAHKTIKNIIALHTSKKSFTGARLKLPFELPDMRSIQETTYEETTYCPKCYQDRNRKLHQDYSDTGHVNPSLQTMTARDPSSSFSSTEETIMNSNPHCKKIGLNLCVDTDQPKDKLDRHVLTRGIMMEVANFAKKLCGTRHKVINDILKHNFNIVMSPGLNPSLLFYSVKKPNDGGLAWFNEVFDIWTLSHRPPRYVSRKRAPTSAMQRSGLRETIQKRKIALQTKGERATLPRSHKSTMKSKKNQGNEGNFYPICTEIGLDLDVTSKSGEKETLDLRLLTRAVVLEIHKFATTKVGHYYPRTVFDILDYNFDLSSQYYRRWEFSIATASKVQTMVKQYCKKQDELDEVFKLPFVFNPNASQRFVEKGQNKKSAMSSLATARESESSCLGIHSSFLTSADISSSLSNVNPLFASQSDENGLCGGEEQTQTARNATSECIMEQEEIKTKNYYTCPLGESDLESDEGTDSENTGSDDHLKNPESCPLSSDIHKSESSCLGMHDTLLTSTDVPSSLPTVNSYANSPFTSQHDEQGLCTGEEQTPSPQSVLNKCDMEQEEMGTENNMWKLRSNRVEQIVSPLNKEFGPFHKSKKTGLEFNVGYGSKQNISVDSLNNSVLLEIAKFAIAINSSQEHFIMEILEYNFDLGLQSQHQRKIFACEIMNRVRQLRCCEDAVKFSNEVFELPGSRPSINMTNQSVGSVIPEPSSISRMEKCDVTPVSPVDSHAETKEHIPHKSVDLSPFCKEIGLKLHVNNSWSNRKLEINLLTNGAMTEVANFAEKLCGTFEQICLDILRHNFDFDLVGGDSDPAKNILARIPALVEQKNLSTSCAKGNSTSNIDFKSNPNLDACSAGSSQAAIIDENIGSSTDIEHKKEINLKLWKLRTKQIQQILSIPHEEHCPLYSYSRCKKLGIDFNVASGIKENLDPKFLTNGILAELNAFVAALLSSAKHFITEILEFNFNLNLKNELYRSAFAHKTMKNIIALRTPKKSCSGLRLKLPFELPDMRCIQEPSFESDTYCPKCYQERNHKLGQDDSDTVHVKPSLQTMTDTVSADVNYTAKKPANDPSSTFSTTEETIMNSYPCCKKIGLTLCVDKDQPTDKLDTHFLTRGIMMEMENFAKKLCGTKFKLLHDLLEHNFNISMQQTPNIDFAQMRRRVMAEEDGGLAYFNEVFVFRPPSHRPPGYVTPMRAAALAIQRSDWRETIQKRRIALQTKEERDTLPSPNNVVKCKKNPWSKEHLYPICTEIGLDLDLMSKSEEKEKLDLNLLTAAVVYEIHKFAIKKSGHYFPGTLFDILDYNFDLSSQHYRRLEFSIATASKVQTMVKQYRKNRDLADKVLELPFVFAPNASQSSVEKRENMKRKRSSQEEPGKKRKKRHSLDVNRTSFLCGLEPNKEPRSHDGDTNYLTDPWMYNVQSNQSLVSDGCGSPLPIKIQIKEEEYDPHYAVTTTEPGAEEKYHPQYYNVKTESNTGDVGHFDPGEPAGSLGCTYISMCPNSENVKTESENEGVQYYILAEPQGSQRHAMLAVCPNTENNITTTEVDSLGVHYWVQGEAAASHGDSMIPVCQDKESTLIREQENMLTDSYNYGVVLYNKSEEESEMNDSLNKCC